MEFKLGSAVVAVSVGIERAPLRDSAVRLPSTTPPKPTIDLEARRRAEQWLVQETLRRERRQVELLGWWNGLYRGGR